MAHYLQLLLGHCVGRYSPSASISDLQILILCLKAFLSSVVFNNYFDKFFRSGDFDQRLETMSVCFAVLISFFILWRLLSVSSTSMPMFRYISISVLLITLACDILDDSHIRNIADFPMF